MLGAAIWAGRGRGGLPHGERTWRGGEEDEGEGEGGGRASEDEGWSARAHSTTARDGGDGQPAEAWSRRFGAQYGRRAQCGRLRGGRCKRSMARRPRPRLPPWFRARWGRAADRGRGRAVRERERERERGRARDTCSVYHHVGLFETDSVLAGRPAVRTAECARLRRRLATGRATGTDQTTGRERGRRHLVAWAPDAETRRSLVAASRAALAHVIRAGGGREGPALAKPNRERRQRRYHPLSFQIFFAVGSCEEGGSRAQDVDANAGVGTPRHGMP
jgi:hypothetical protein